MGFLLSCGHVGTTVWMQYQYFNIMHGEKARGELPKSAACCFKRMLEAAPYKTPAVCSLSSYLTTILVCWTLWTHMQHSFVDSYSWTPQYWLASNDIHLFILCPTTGQIWHKAFFKVGPDAGPQPTRVRQNPKIPLSPSGRPRGQETNSKQ